MPKPTFTALRLYVDKRVDYVGYITHIRRFIWFVTPELRRR